MTQYKYFGYLCRQRADQNTIPFFVFTAKAKEIVKWVAVKRTEKVAKGHQRVLRPARSKSIKHFLQSESINTIPNNILIAFDQGKATFTPTEDAIKSCFSINEMKNGCEDNIEWGFLEFENDDQSTIELDRAALLVDGQHRLYGISSYDDENLPLLVVSLLGANTVEQAFQFIVVNNKQVKVPTDNIKSIVADFDEKDLERRITAAGVKYGDHSPLLKQINDIDESPFRNLLTWDYNREKGKDDKLVPVTTIEQSLRYLQESLEFLKEDTDTLVDIFLAIWTGVKNAFPNLWNKDAKFMKKVNLNAINELMTVIIKSAWKSRFIDIFDTPKITLLVESYFEEIPDEFWTKKWPINIQDNSNVRNLIKSDIDRIKENVDLNVDWQKDLELITEELEEPDGEEQQEVTSD